MPPHRPLIRRREGQLLALILATACAFTPYLAAAQPLRAQERTPPAADSTTPASFAARGMMPVSATTLMHYVLEPNPGGGARLGYVLVIRGAPGWYVQRQGSATERPAPDFEMQHWTIGDLQYSIGYSAVTQRLLVFGQMINLRHEPVVFVTLDPAEDEPMIRAGPESRFVMERPGDFRLAFLRATPELRVFAGLP